MKNTILALLIFSLASSAMAGPVTGKIQFAGRPPGVSLQTVVYAEPLDGGRPQPGRFKVMQKNKSFVPRVLAVPVGSTISFPNDDLIFHNVFSLSRPNPFDLGLYRAGDSKDRTFTTAAIYQVFCNIHPQMSATILVVPSSYITEADKSGAYRFDLPAGRYRITAWSERAAEPTSVEVTVSATVQIAPILMLTETQAADAQHKNKFGQSYPASAYDPMKH
jgi:plastocyanin